jgi:hypothetical protein
MHKLLTEEASKTTYSAIKVDERSVLIPDNNETIETLKFKQSIEEMQILYWRIRQKKHYNHLIPQFQLRINSLVDEIKNLAI